MAVSVSSGAKWIASPTRTSIAPDRNHLRRRSLEFAQPANRHGQHRRKTLFDQKPDAGLKARELACSRAGSLGKYHHTVAVVQSLACMGEAGLEVAPPRQRKHIEERRDQPICLPAPNT